MAFAVGERQELEELVDRLRDRGVETRGLQKYAGPDAHAEPTEFVCFRDPDNVQLEFWLT